MSPSNRLTRLCLVALPAVLAPGPVRAALDPETQKPYQVRLVLSFGDRPEFTPLFKDRLKHSLGDGLQAALGKLGRVRVLDRDALEKAGAGKPGPDSLDATYRLLQEVERRGLQEALDAWKEVSDSKTHFVLIDMDQGQYVVKARQFDGPTGLASPLVRTARTADREFIPRVASYWVEQDFGAAGTLEPNFRVAGQDPEVTVALQAGSLGGSLGPWVKPGEVFAVAQIRQGQNGVRAYRMPDVLLQATAAPRGGVCRCRVLHRYPDPLPRGPSVLGYRCLKLGTTTAKVQLRLVDHDGIPVPSLQYEVCQDQFGLKTNPQGAMNADGFTPPLGPFRNVARVRILARGGGKILAEFPVEILDGRPVVRSLQPDPEAEKLGQPEFEKRSLVKRLGESLLAVGGLADELNRISKDRQATRERATAGLRTLQADLAVYADEIERLRKALGQAALADAEKRFEVLRGKQTQLQAYVKELENVIAEESDPLRAELFQMANQAQLLEGNAEFDEAVALYEKIVLKGGDQPFVRKYADHLAKLKKEWEPKSDEHRQAREFIYRTWPALKTAAELKGRMAEAKKALQACGAAGDRRTPLKLLKSNTAHANYLAKRLDAILKSDGKEDKQEVQAIVEVQKDLESLTTEATKLAQGGKSAEK